MKAGGREHGAIEDAGEFDVDLELRDPLIHAFLHLDCRNARLLISPKAKDCAAARAPTTGERIRVVRGQPSRRPV
jgi:hypothetical protein